MRENPDQKTLNTDTFHAAHGRDDSANTLSPSFEDDWSLYKKIPLKGSYSLIKDSQNRYNGLPFNFMSIYSLFKYFKIDVWQGSEHASEVLSE